MNKYFFKFFSYKAGADPGFGDKEGASCMHGVCGLPWSPQWVQDKSLVGVQGARGRLPDSRDFFTVKMKSLKSDFRYISSHFRHWKGHKSENPEIAPVHMEIETK